VSVSYVEKVFKEMVQRAPVATGAESASTSVTTAANPDESSKGDGGTENGSDASGAAGDVGESAQWKAQPLSSHISSLILKVILK
jgi:hypothetical protein